MHSRAASRAVLAAKSRLAGATPSSRSPSTLDRIAVASDEDSDQVRGGGSWENVGELTKTRAERVRQPSPGQHHLHAKDEGVIASISHSSQGGGGRLGGQQCGARCFACALDLQDVPSGGGKADHPCRGRLRSPPLRHLLSSPTWIGREAWTARGLMQRTM